MDEIIYFLESWKEYPPEAALAIETELATDSGERHGSWFTEFMWNEGGLQRAAEVAVTNPTALADSEARAVWISVRASASSATRWSSTSIYEGRRSLSPLTTRVFDEWANAAVRIAATFTLPGLTETYTLPSRSTDEQ